MQSYYFDGVFFLVDGKFDSIYFSETTFSYKFLLAEFVFQSAGIQ